MSNKATIEKSTDGEHYAIILDDEESPEVFEYGQVATALDKEGHLHYVMLADKDDKANVRKVISSEEIETDYEEVEMELPDPDDDEEDKCECGAEITDPDATNCPVCGVELT